MELAEVKAAAELELKAKLLEAAQAELGRAQAELSKREAAVAAAEQAARTAAASARDRAASSQAAAAEAERALAAQRQQLEKVRNFGNAFLDDMACAATANIASYTCTSDLLAADAIHVIEVFFAVCCCVAGCYLWPAAAGAAAQRPGSAVSGAVPAGVLAGPAGSAAGHH
jgi:hypothetical protein